MTNSRDAKRRPDLAEREQVIQNPVQMSDSSLEI
ncbi:uncharacterized protein METZ01_LOCUS470209 [marine metagenome]|uniref:Uncharacterized protein n=1 Tax=marine metagenome TaxID=408172 RepID=A0A383BD58_9ZZZZ